MGIGALTPPTRSRLFVPALLAIYGAVMVVLYGFTASWEQAIAASSVLRWVPAIDLVVVPLLLYGLFNGWRRLASVREFPIHVAAVGLLTLRFIVPPSFRPPEGMLEMAVGIVEVGLLTFLILRVRSLRRAYGAYRRLGEGTYESLRRAILEIGAFPASVGAYFAAEANVLVTLLAYRRIRAAETRGLSFSYTKRGGAGWVYGAILFLVLMESIAVHAAIITLTPQSWHFVAWLLAAGNLYGLLWLLADYLAMTARPHRIDGGTLHVRLGFRQSAAIPLHRIEEVATHRPGHPRGGESPAKGLRGSAAFRPVLTDCNVEVTLTEPVEVVNMVGQTEEVRRITLSVDSPEAFLDALRSAGVTVR